MRVVFTACVRGEYRQHAEEVIRANCSQAAACKAILQSLYIHPDTLTRSVADAIPQAHVAPLTNQIAHVAHDMGPSTELYL